MNIIEQLVSLKLAENTFSASNMANGLKLADLPDDEAKIERAMLYRRHRMIGWKSNRAYELAIAGEIPNEAKFILNELLDTGTDTDWMYEEIEDSDTNWDFTITGKLLKRLIVAAGRESDVHGN